MTTRTDMAAAVAKAAGYKMDAVVQAAARVMEAAGISAADGSYALARECIRIAEIGLCIAVAGVREGEIEAQLVKGIHAVHADMLANVPMLAESIRKGQLVVKSTAHPTKVVVDIL